jgi:hypothetical protein
MVMESTTPSYEVVERLRGMYQAIHQRAAQPGLTRRERRELCRAALNYKRAAAEEERRYYAVLRTTYGTAHSNGSATSTPPSWRLIIVLGMCAVLSVVGVVYLAIEVSR